MKERGLKKPPGCSWIPFGFQTHAFVVGDLSHPQFEAFNWVVTDLSNKMRKKKRTRLQLLKNMILTSGLIDLNSIFLPFYTEYTIIHSSLLYKKMLSRSVFFNSFFAKFVTW